MRVKLLLLLLCVTSLPDSLPAQLGFEEVLIDSALINHPDPQKRLAGEIAAAQAALARKESSAGAQSPEIADAVSALANLYLKTGDYERASPLIERALKIRRTSLGDDHLDTAASFHQLAEFREELGSFAEAQKLYGSALRVREHADSNSAETAATRHALGRLLSKMDNLAEAERLLREALAVEEQKLAKDVQTAYTLYELAKIEARIGHGREAATLSGRAYEIFAETLGKQNPDTEDARSMMEPLADTLSNALVNAGMQISSIGEQKALPTRKRLSLSGPFNAQEAQRLSDAAELLEAGNADDREQALLMQERSLRIRQRVLGPEHPQTLQSLQRLGVAALDQGQTEKALAIARKAMFAQTRHLQRVFSFADEQQRLAFRRRCARSRSSLRSRRFPQPIWPPLRCGSKAPFSIRCSRSVKKRRPRGTRRCARCWRVPPPPETRGVGWKRTRSGPKATLLSPLTRDARHLRRNSRKSSKTL